MRAEQKVKWSLPLYPHVDGKKEHPGRKLASDSASSHTGRLLEGVSCAGRGVAIQLSMTGLTSPRAKGGAGN